MAYGTSLYRGLRLRIMAKRGARVSRNFTRRVFANAEKIQYLRMYETSKMAAAKFERTYRLPQHSIEKWKTRSCLLEGADPAGFSSKRGLHRAVEWGLNRWVLNRVRTPGLSVAPGMIAEHAKAIALRCGIMGFKASRSWCTKFRRRFGFVCVTLRGERASADHDAAREYPATFRKFCGELNIETTNIYNMDETLLYPRVGSKKAVCPVALAREIRGCTQQKTRIGMLVTSCADGRHDVPVLFSSVSGAPRAMKGKNYRDVQLNVKCSSESDHYYVKSHNAWVSRDMVVYYMTVILPQHIRQKTPGPTNALLLMDGCSMHATALYDIFAQNLKGVDAANPDGPVLINCTGFVPQIRSTFVAAPARPPAHEPIMNRIRAHGVDLVVGDVRLHIRTLPAKTTSELQPCDQGLISWLKQQWRVEVDRRLLAATSREDAADVSKDITGMDAMSLITARLRSISPLTGMRYWRALMDPDSRTYADVVQDCVTVAEGILASEEKATYD